MKTLRMLSGLGSSVLRIASALLVVLGAPLLLYWLWNPAGNAPAEALDFRENGIWIGHGWLGGNDWFTRYRVDPNYFRNPERIEALLEQLEENRIRFVYAHLCPSELRGGVAPYDPAQVERFLDAAGRHGIAVLPWIGGVLGESARPSDPVWRRNFIASVGEMLAQHPRLAGVELNIEPLPSGDRDFLTLLEELRPVLGNRILGIAAYPPPTRWHPFADLHWDRFYLAEVAKRSDQLAVMMYDTGIRFEKFYIYLLRQWGEELERATAGTGCRVLYGLPAYDDNQSGYHDPKVENLGNALTGVLAAPRAANVTGCAIYCEWEMTPDEWQLWRRHLAGN